MRPSPPRLAVPAAAMAALAAVVFGPAAHAQTLPALDAVAAQAEAAGLAPADAAALARAAAAAAPEETAVLRASNAGEDDSFGYAVAVSGHVAVVGAYYEDGAANDLGDSGAAYVFERSGGAWAETAVLRASNAGTLDYFGYAVAVSGGVVVVGAYYEDGAANDLGDSGAAYVFERSGGAWAETAVLRASNAGTLDYFGYAVAVSGDVAVVGATRENGAANNVSSSGAAYVFERSGGAWAETAVLRASNAGVTDYFGYAVAVSGDVAVVGAYLEDGAANNVSNSGAAYVFERSGGAWAETAVLRASNAGAQDNFGSSVAVSGDVAVVGAFSEDGAANDLGASGAAYVFERSGGAWPATETAVLRASNAGGTDFFGRSVAVSGGVVVVGALYEDGAANDLGDSGAAYVFERSGGAWAETAVLRASNAESIDFFGWSVAVSGDVAVVGAYWEDGAANNVSNSGSAYAYSLFETVAVGEAEGYHLVAAPGDAETVGSFLGPVYTQCFPGADYDGDACANGTDRDRANVFFYAEPTDGDATEGYAEPASASVPFAPGVGAAVYLFADDDFDGTDDGFPKALPLDGDEPALPFTWGDTGAGADAPLSFTDTASDDAEDGWNLLGNPVREPLDWTAVWANNTTNVAPTAYGYDPVTGWSSYDANEETGSGTGPMSTGAIPAGTGFFVRATGPGPSLEAVPVGAPRRAGSPHVAVRVAALAAGGPLAGRSISGGATVVLAEGAAVGPDAKDAPSLAPVASPAVWVAAVEAGGPALAQAMVPTGLGQTVDVDLAVGLAGVATAAEVTWTTALPAGWKALLFDRQSGAEVEMVAGGSYPVDLAGSEIVDGVPTGGRLAVRIVPVGATAGEPGVSVAEVSLARPNPTARRSVVRIAVPSSERVRVSVVDALGREVAVAFDGVVTGSAEVAVEAGRLAPGVYVVRVVGESFAETRSLTVVR